MSLTSAIVTVIRSLPIEALPALFRAVRAIADSDAPSEAAERAAKAAASAAVTEGVLRRLLARMRA